MGVALRVLSGNFRSLIVATLETGDDGGLHVPPELIGGATPHAKFDLEVVGDVLVLRPIAKGEPFWQRATSQQRAAEFQHWVDSPRPPAPDLTDESLRRERLYDR